ncbi:ribulose-phosphate 3-epimerase [Clostridium tetani]|uniref:Ribulose-phosphate 3-epimerase n=2 Tax=Clostridium tetani TaxID=1513 RepID=Q895P4_CLOTE|nr:ribulose-phosphate 3-epimerase [Clostridium tetani]AAO35796.1 ribulose-phosphate 3-epimerase [Clostridium tetani E88]AVP53684.1 ribulose-phosphate 3-epimerase [Clostridium tetani]KGI38308.1 ribulose-phosphate 3-epimerase [Clostridium tetani]KGI40183.1 ribulose-phosphate 3-epimerase [Clostridium tetani ATCC 9441]KGI41741.1 ribulose-phosphate 3-epimerase [Clostridium tetani]
MVKIAPSILSADFANLGRDIEAIEKYGAHVVHFDVMDGKYVPNISFGVPIMKSIKGLTKLPFDVHLMIEEPSKYIEDFAKAGADIITFHYEAETHLDRTINYIKSFGVKAGIALNPGTPVSLIKDLIPSLDMVLIMSVNPGFGGQKYIYYASDKIRELKKLKDELNKDLIIEVDGGVGKDNIKDIANCGVDLVVAGSAVFKDGKIEENLKVLREALR